MSWTLRCRGPSGQATLQNLSADSTLEILQSLIQDQLGVPLQQQTLLSGFPPRPLDLSNSSSTLSAAGLQNGDVITVREEPAAAPQPAAPPAAAAQQPSAVAASGGLLQSASMDDDAALQAAINASLSDARLPVAAAAPAGRSPPAAAAAAAPAAGGAGNAPGQAPTAVQLADGACLVRRIIASDNSCLFNAVGYLMEGRRDKAPQLRQVIAEAVAGDPVEYNEGFLGKDNDEYCKWIKNKSNWGGAIELFILSRHYGCQLAAYDIQTKRCDVYGEELGFQDRALLIYDGLHYDALAVSAFAGAPEELDVTRFPAEGTEATSYTRAAEQLVEGCHDARQFTNTNTFTLRCGACMVGLKGAKEAQMHAQETGHTNFTEY